MDIFFKFAFLVCLFIYLFVCLFSLMQSTGGGSDITSNWREYQ